MSRAVGNLMQKVLMVPPKFFKFQYKINPMTMGVVDQPKAQAQWDVLRNAIEKAGVTVKILEPVYGLPDMVFACNGGLVHNNKVYLAKFIHRERSGEEKYYASWFAKNGYEEQGRDGLLCFEGGRDALFSTPDTLWAGFGPRTDKEVYELVAKLGTFEVVLCELRHEHFYHLDLCFCPVDETTALWYSPAFSKQTCHDIPARLPHLIAVSEAEAMAFVCGAITIRKTVFSPLGIAKETVQKLADRGFSVVEVDMSEFIKAGGACQSLVMKL